MSNQVYRNQVSTYISQDTDGIQTSIDNLVNSYSTVAIPMTFVNAADSFVLTVRFTKYNKLVTINIPDGNFTLTGVPSGSFTTTTTIPVGYIGASRVIIRTRDVGNINTEYGVVAVSNVLVISRDVNNTAYTVGVNRGWYKVSASYLQVG